MFADNPARPSHNLIASIAAAILLCLTSPSFCMAGTAYEAAMELYAKKNYAGAVQKFMEELRVNQKGINASNSYLYAGVCYQQLGQVAYAKQMYSCVCRYFGGTKNADTARAYFDALSAPVKPSTATTASGTAQPATGAAATAQPATSSAGNMDVSSLITIVKPQADHPAVSHLTVSTVKQALETLPPGAKKILLENQIKVCLTPTLIDRDPQLKNREGRGYDGHTYKSCPGMFDGGSVVICERTMDEADESINEPFSSAEILDTLYHETGHAMDFCGGNVSTTQEFKHIYRLDAANVQREPQLASKLSYFLQKAEAGQEECCAELIGMLLGSQEKYRAEMQAAFAQTLGFLRKKLSI